MGAQRSITTIRSGRLEWKAVPEGTTSYGYDDAGHVTGIGSSTADGAAAAYTYDELGSLETVTDANGQVTWYGFDHAGNLEHVNLPNRVTTPYGYDENNRPRGVPKPSTAAIACAVPRSQ